jgi:formylglycine-generating enzyme
VIALESGSDAPNDASMAVESGVDAATPPSCIAGGPGRSDCGPNHESCCTSPLVTGGTYYRTYTNNGCGPTDEGDPAMISSFRLDKYDVTVGRFRQFLNAWNGGAGYTPPAGSGKHTYLNGGQGLTNSGSPGAYETGWDAADWSLAIAPTDAALGSCAPYSTWTNAASTQENLPMNCANWYEAYAFCIWDGGFLPSEAEWEYAAAGGDEELEYPWGAATPGTTNQYAIYGCYYASGAGACLGVASIAPVGTATSGAGLYGQLDLTGNVYQWNLDWYAPYASCVDCADTTAGSSRVIRGGVFLASFLLPPNRSYYAPASRYSGIGFRCSRAP